MKHFHANRNGFRPENIPSCVAAPSISVKNQSISKIFPEIVVSVICRIPLASARITGVFRAVRYAPGDGAAGAALDAEKQERETVTTVYVVLRREIYGTDRMPSVTGTAKWAGLRSVTRGSKVKLFRFRRCRNAHRINNSAVIRNISRRTTGRKRRAPTPRRFAVRKMRV